MKKWRKKKNPPPEPLMDAVEEYIPQKTSKMAPPFHRHEETVEKKKKGKKKKKSAAKVHVGKPMFSKKGSRPPGVKPMGFKDIHMNKSSLGPVLLKKAMPLETGQWKAGTLMSDVLSSSSSVPSPVMSGLSPFHVDMGEVSLIRLVGEGAFGSVYEATWKGERVAVKLLRGGPELGMRERQSFLEEVKVMATLSHRNVVQYMGAIVEGERLALLTEFMEQGSLYSILYGKEETPEFLQRLKWAKDIANGLSFLHARDYIHRDLKSPNVLVDAEGRAKLADLGFTKVVQSMSMHTQVGTPQWMAPEVMRSSSYTFSADVYSYGMVLYELLTLRLPAEREWQPITVMFKVNEGWRPPIPSTVPGELKELIQRCWDTDPQKRPSMADCLRIVSVVLGEMLGDSTTEDVLLQSADMVDSSVMNEEQVDSGLFGE